MGTSKKGAMAKDTVIYMLAKGIEGVVGVVTMSVMTYLFATFQMGLYSTVNIAITTIGMVAIQWLVQSVLRYVNKYDILNQQKEFYSTVFSAWKSVNVGVALIALIIILVVILIINLNKPSQKEPVKKEPVVEKKEEKKKEDPEVNFTISFAGDCTLGNYAGQANDGSFNQEYQREGKDLTYFLKKVKDVFEKDDLTVVNLEGPLTTASNHLEKEFPFSGNPEYTKILTSSSVEAVTLANNHSEDYYEAGLQDTKKYLDEASIGHFGYDENYIREIKGIKCGFLGYRSLSLSMNNEKGRQQIQEAINHLKNDEKCQLVFVYYHWGIERQYQANDDQRSLAKFTIDAGADAVIGSHPHVVQGTETYNGKPIVYSLGNFCFGGNRNPSDTDTMIYQLSYTFKGTNQLDYKVQIIPCSLTSSRGRNDYQPYILQGDEANRVMEKIKKYSY